jgi:hypothetical protein
MFRPFRVDHTNCLQVAIKTHSFKHQKSKKHCKRTHGAKRRPRRIMSLHALVITLHALVLCVMRALGVIVPVVLQDLT